MTGPMITSIRPRLTYANVVSTLALVLVVTGGTAYAARAMVSGASLVNGSVSTSKLANNAVTGIKVRNGSLAPADLSAGARAQFTDTAAEERSRLTGVDGAGSGVDADTVDGLDSGAFLGATAAAGGALTGTFPNPTLAAGSVGPSELLNAGITSADLGSDSVTGSQVDDGSLVGDDIAIGRASLPLNFGSIAGNTCTSAGTTVDGASLGDFVLVGGAYVNLGAYSTGELQVDGVATNGNVAVRVCNVTTGAIDPDPTSFDVLVIAN